MDINTDPNTDRWCENCGRDWRGAPECPVCDHVTPPDTEFYDEPLSPAEVMAAHLAEFGR